MRLLNIIFIYWFQFQMVAFDHILLIGLSVNYRSCWYKWNCCFYSRNCCEGADFDFVFYDLEVVKSNNERNQTARKRGEQSCAPDVMWRVLLTIKVNLKIKFSFSLICCVCLLKAKIQLWIRGILIRWEKALHMRFINGECTIINIVYLNSFFFSVIIYFHVLPAIADFTVWLEFSYLHYFAVQILVIFHSVQPSFVNCIIY